MFDNIDTLIFDMDGTLINSMGIWKEIDIEYLGSLSIPLPDDLQKAIEGMCFKDVAVYMKKRFNINDSIDHIQEIWTEMAEYKYGHEVKLKDGVKDFLKAAKEKGFKLGIATSNSRHLTDIALKALEIDIFFDYVLTGCDTLKSKPDPEIYLTAAKGLNADPSKCLVFEDIIPGIMAGKNAGMKVCCVDDYYSEYCRAEKTDLADYYIYSYGDIIL